MTTFAGVPEGAGRRIAIVAARFNEAITSKLVEGALAGLREHGVSDDGIDLGREIGERVWQDQGLVADARHADDEMLSPEQSLELRDIV